jgi:2,6-dihydroxypyridine 3-monooxygenase
MTPRATIIGGSLGGLITGLMLRRSGVEVDIYERHARSLESRGAGLRIQPAMTRLFAQALEVDLDSVSAHASSIRYVDGGGAPVHQFPEAVQYTSWGALYALLASAFGKSRYHLGAELTGFEQDADAATAVFRDGRRVRSDLLVFADGVNSTGRRLLFPEVCPHYAGYICWRGYLHEDALSAGSRELLSDAMTIALLGPGHVHVYPIPGAVMDAGVGGQCFNYIWYRNLAGGEDFRATMTDSAGVFRASSVPPGGVKPAVVDELKASARNLLPPSIAELVNRTASPFIQAISDINAGAMAAGRVCLIGDAASGGRPHLGAATTKATINAFMLAQALQTASGDVPAALANWAPQQVQFGNRISERNRDLGNLLQFGGAIQPGDPRLRPGIDDLVAEALA